MMKTRTSALAVGTILGLAFIPTNGLRCWTWPFAVPGLQAQELIQLPGEDVWLEVDFEEVYRVGAVFGEDWEQFGNVRKVAFDGAGQLFVFDNQADRVFVVGPDGQYRRAFGRAGEGPGEFRNPVALAVFRDGRAVVADTRHRAYHIFDANGDFERMVRMVSEGALVVVTDLLPDPDGGALYSAVGAPTLSMSYSINAGAGPTPHISRPVERVWLTGEVAIRDTVAEGWLPQEGETPDVNVGGFEIGIRLPLPRVFGPRMLPGVLPDGDVVFSDSSAYAIKIARPGTGVWRILTRPLQPVPVTSRVIEAEKERRLKALEESPDGGGVINGVAISSEDRQRRARERIANLEFFDEVSIVRDLSTTWNGGIWVQRRREDASAEDGPIDVLSAEGRYLGSYPAGTIKMPAAFGPKGLAAFVEEDELGVKVVVVRRLPERVN